MHPCRAVGVEKLLPLLADLPLLAAAFFFSESCNSSNFFSSAACCAACCLMMAMSSADSIVQVGGRWIFKMFLPCGCVRFFKKINPLGEKNEASHGKHLKMSCKERVCFAFLRPLIVPAQPSKLQTTTGLCYIFVLYIHNNKIHVLL